MIVAVIGFVLMGVLALVAIGVVFAAFALFVKALPLLIVGWAAVQLIRRFESRSTGLRPADASWLDTRG